MADDNLKMPPNDRAAQTGDTGDTGEYVGAEEKTLVLRRPIKQHADDENPITELHLTEPTARQLSLFLKTQNKAGADDVEAGIAFIAANVGLKQAQLMDMGTRDMTEALDFLSGFTPAGPTTGRT